MVLVKGKNNPCGDDTLLTTKLQNYDTVRLQFTAHHLSHASYINEILARFSMQDSKKGFVPFRVESSLSVNQRPKTPAEIERMREILYASAVEVLCM